MKLLLQKLPKSKFGYLFLDSSLAGAESIHPDKIKPQIEYANENDNISKWKMDYENLKINHSDSLEDLHHLKALEAKIMGIKPTEVDAYEQAQNATIIKNPNLKPQRTDYSQLNQQQARIIEYVDVRKQGVPESLARDYSLIMTRSKENQKK